MSQEIDIFIWIFKIAICVFCVYSIRDFREICEKSVALSMHTVRYHALQFTQNSRHKFIEVSILLKFKGWSYKSDIPLTALRIICYYAVSPFKWRGLFESNYVLNGTKKNTKLGNFVQCTHILNRHFLINKLILRLLAKLFVFNSIKLK